MIREVTGLKLLGRGGAAFPTGRKWEAVAQAPARPHYLVCNADESEPGTFKDRVLMEEDPFAVVEAMTIAGFATGCERGYLYIRGEYPLAIGAAERAIAAGPRRGLLGDNVHRMPASRFDIELRRGAGAYICGEETALFNSIEGCRGEPRNKPPFPVQAGLFGKPTVVNNVETLVNVLDIVAGRRGRVRRDRHRAVDRHRSCSACRATSRGPASTRSPFGITLRELHRRWRAGFRDGRRSRRCCSAARRASFVAPDELDMPLTFEGTRAAGASLGSGVVMVFDDTVDLRDIVAAHRRVLPRRVVRPVRAVPRRHRAAGGAAAPARRPDRPLGSIAAHEIALLEEIGQAMRDASICGLGQTASNADRVGDSRRSTRCSERKQISMTDRVSAILRPPP